MQKNVLIIDKNRETRELLFDLLRLKKVKVVSVCDQASALKHLKDKRFDLVFADQKLPCSPEIPQVQTPKPFDEKAVLALLNSYTTDQEMIANSPSMRKIIEKAKKIALSEANVFIHGESGVGKEVIASLIHDASKRQMHPFVKVNCAALSRTLIESEFFGHEKGAFTGAIAQRIGRFELADQGTLLLDEISEIPAALQAKLLRVVQEQELERVGGAISIPINVRLISTSNRDMLASIKEKEFRSDLYYRLNVIPIEIPPLRERVEDILPLADYFLNLASKKNDVKAPNLTKKDKELLLGYTWPGNIRELANLMEQFVVMGELNVCTKKLSHVPFTNLPLREVEKRHIEATLQAFDNNRTKTANALGISIRTLRNKLNNYRAFPEAP
ncbi:MAG: Anaerobic nitric oxide reductase transcription regulator NorR [Chlamydiia bacterium]|nr:Anaerobic nitric oxide reductase transcription regulator NorR [Chlamydiia bacterium]MCH9615072.1 Anaerobic nitric oxide reductase transcription regulator NorR [Chlamydiia bacterium]MCH9628606.1 Anaerobic nitric oxide reductase transcription regulator NorR [Chlamydiia bacterium]